MLNAEVGFPSESFPPIYMHNYYDYEGRGCDRCSHTHRPLIGRFRRAIYYLVQTAVSVALNLRGDCPLALLR